MTVSSRLRLRGAILRYPLAKRIFVGTFLTMVALALCQEAYRWTQTPIISAPASARHLLSSGGEVIPGFSGACDAQASWEGDSYAVVHVIIVIYLFLGIAIICDEQFTSSLESICHPRTGLGLTPDVAGATFMAAGSSAPELASSFMGTFVSKSDVGLGTIIGSAVFNILIIIGATAIIVGEPMQLDPKPLVRDNAWYLGSVILLIFCVISDDIDKPAIEVYEAGILLAYYISYIIFLANNRYFMGKCFPKQPKQEEGGHKQKSRRPSFSSGLWADKKEDPKDEEVTKDPPPAATEGGSGSGSGGGQISRSQIAMMPDRAASPGMDDIETLDINPTATAIDINPTAASMPGVPSGSGNGAGGDGVELPNAVEATPSAVKADGMTPEPLDPPLPAAEGGKEEAKEEKEEEEEEPGAADMILDVLSAPYIFLYDWTMPDCKYEEPSDEEQEEEIKELQEKLDAETDASKKVELTDEIANIQQQIDLRGEIEEAEENEEDEKVIELRKKLFSLYEPLTRAQELYLWTFGVSLIWITVLSYFMVVLMEKIGCAWGISSFIMGITFLAMGTSVPDALGSIAVAKEGEGDMAVSNAIGSNVFDICMGLGFPWFLATLIDGEARGINASIASIISSTVILLMVVVVLFATLASTKHPETGKNFVLNPFVGYVLFACYGAFVVYQLVWAAVKGE